MVSIYFAGYLSTSMAENPFGKKGKGGMGGETKGDEQYIVNWKVRRMRRWIPACAGMTERNLDSCFRRNDQRAII